ncbi:MAG TPA: ATP synthase F1 subunit gamma [Acidimicrobiales bacterium]|nr:ATP synthase F1 subunit gamma [Acidimicrobiales bacterium]
MPAGQERALRRRVRSVQSTQKITRAMELIAASRIARAQAAIIAAKPYAEQMRAVVGELASTPEARGHWLFSGSGSGTLVVVLAADRGLSGAFNSSVLRAAEELLRSLGSTEPTVIAVGRRAVAYFNFRGRPLAQHFEGMADRPRFEDAQRIVQAVASQLESGSFGQIYLVSTRFITSATQRPEARKLVPMGSSDSPGAAGSGPVFEFEPGPAEILDKLLPRWLEAELYAALLESAASFHVAQQRAMKAATDNADELIKSLRRAMNRARQDSITTEIMEIVGGAEALRDTTGADTAVTAPDVYISSAPSPGAS